MQPRRSPIRHQPPRPSRDDLLRPQGHSCLHHRLCRLSTRRSPRRFAQTCRQSPPPLRKRRQRKFLLHPPPPLTVFLGFSVVVTFSSLRCLCALCVSESSFLSFNLTLPGKVKLNERKDDSETQSAQRQRREENVTTTEKPRNTVNGGGGWRRNFLWRRFRRGGGDWRHV